METESPAFIPTTFNTVPTSYISTPSAPPASARLYFRQPQSSQSYKQRQKPLPVIPSPPQAQLTPASSPAPAPSQSPSRTPPPSSFQQRNKPQAPSKLGHNSRASTDSLFDLLADLDENQLSYLVQELNNTTSSNLAVSDAITSFEKLDPVAPSRRDTSTPTQSPGLQRTMSKSQKMRLSLQTMFRAPSVRQRPQQPAQPEPTTRQRQPAYKRISRPAFDLPPGVTLMDLLALLESEFRSHNASHTLSPSASMSQLPTSPASLNSSFSSVTSSSPITPNPHARAIRRYPSMLDITLEAERSASGTEGLALGLLEPRPTTPACGTPISARSSPITPSWDRKATPPPPGAGPAPPVVLDGIFEVLSHK